MRGLLLPLFLLGGCFLFEPTETGPQAFVGRIVSPRGIPVAGLPVKSLEARGATNAEGRISVAWKPPNQHVSFAWEGARYMRRYTVEDEGQQVALRLPEVRNAAVSCQVSAPCALKLTWELDNGLQATADGVCAANGPPLLGIPKGSPTAVCVESPTEALKVSDFGERMLFEDSPRELTLRVEGTGCRIAVGGGEWRAGNVLQVTMSGETTASAVCAEGPALPVRLGPGDREATLVVNPGDAWVEVDAVPGEGRTRIVAESGPLKGVAGVLEVRSGRVRLPVGLPAGSYRLVAGSLGLLTQAPTPEAHGLAWRRTEDGWTGRLVLREPLAIGAVPSARITAP
jgi:hypothetical protein